MIIAIIDDNRMNIQLLESMLRTLSLPELEIYHAQDVSGGIQLLNTKQPDLVLLDIELGDGYGFDILDGSEYKGYGLIIVSAYPQFALQSYEYHPVHYLLKPVKEADLVSGIERFLHLRGENTSLSQATSFDFPRRRKKKRISLPENGRLYFVDLAEIVYFESSNVYTIVHLAEGKSVVVSKTLGSYEQMLPASSFHRIHDRYIINLEFISSYTRGRGGSVELSNGQVLDVSTRRKQTFLTKLQGQHLG
ncbi:MAG: LytTR family DNA-binding domain-containing protein [Bacteroidota bacterium]